MCLSHSKNFRKELNASYKSNRTAPKPKLLPDVRAYVELKYNCECLVNCEADDTLSILGTTLDNSVVCSTDKDMLTIRDTTVYNWKRGTFEITDPQTAQWHHYYQTIKGDTVDGYGGAKGIGDKKARLALETACTWDNVVNTFAIKGQSADEALLMARMAKLLTPELYDRSTGEVSLWQPKDYLCQSVKPSETKEVAV
jgi:5'-3' exonuclease